MKIGFFGIRYPKGIGVQLEDYARTAEAKGHQAFFLTYPLSRRKGVLTKGDWARDNVTIAGTFKKNSVEVSDEAIATWIINNSLDMVFVMEQPKNWNVFSICKKLNVPSLNYVNIEMFDRSKPYEDCTMFLCATKQAEARLNQYGLTNVSFIKYSANNEHFLWQKREVLDKVHFVMHNGWGGMNGRKGLEPTIRAYSKTTVDSKLTIITQKKWKTYSEQIRQIANCDDRIEILEINDTDNVFNSAAYKIGHVAIQPSLWEGLGLTYIEAMACGMPIITCDGPPMNEYVADRRTGLLVSCKEVPGETIKSGLEVPAFVVDEQKLAEAIATVANNPKFVAVMSDNTRRQPSEYDEYVEAFDNLLTKVRGIK